jgi:hypothetical protein
MRCIALHTRIPLIQLAVVAPAQIPTNHQSRSLLWPLLAVVVTACVAHPTPADAAGDRQTLVLESASAREFSTNHKVFLEQGTPTTTRVKVKPLIALLFSSLSLSFFVSLPPLARGVVQVVQVVQVVVVPHLHLPTAISAPRIWLGWLWGGGISLVLCGCTIISQSTWPSLCSIPRYILSRISHRPSSALVGTHVFGWV